MARISEFKAHMTGGGARANQFRVILTFPSFVPAGTAGFKAQFLCKASQLPGSTIENIPIQYRGRTLNFAGERTFAPWPVTIYNDTDFELRNAFEIWSDRVQNNTSTDGLVNPLDYQVQLFVQQLDRAGSVIKSYTFVDAYPTEISPIAVDYDQANVIETFDVTFTYNYWTSTTTTNAETSGVVVPIPF